MSALERQSQIIQDLIIRAPHLGLQIDRVHQVGDETPDTHIFTLNCSCRDVVNIGFDQGKEGEWVMKALNTVRLHAQAKHSETEVN
jgi:hypothetical protein